MKKINETSRKFEETKQLFEEGTTYYRYNGVPQDHSSIQEIFHEIKDLYIPNPHAKITRRMTLIMVEMTQNVYKYQYVPFEEVQLQFTKYHDTLLFRSSNTSNTQDAADLLTFLHQCNHLNHQQLKQFYIDKVRGRKSTLSYKGSHGVGIVDTIRKSGNPIEYNVQQLDKEKAFVELIAHFNIPDDLIS